MWRLTATLLLASLASASPRAGFGYLPPKRDCETVTSVVYDTSVQTSVVVQTVNQVDTRYVKTTVHIQQVVPTTLYRTQVQTQIQYQTSVIHQTTVRYVDRVVTQTVTSPPRQEVRYITTTRVVPQVRYVTQTQVQTQVVPVEVTRTQIQTVVQPVVNYQTQVVQQTRYATVPGPTTVRTRVQTVVQTSLVRQQQPANTRYVTSTSVRQVVQTSVVRGQDVIRTSVVQRQQVIPSPPSTPVTKMLTPPASRSSPAPTSSLRLKLLRRSFLKRWCSPSPRVQTVVQTQYVTPYPVYQTREVTRTSVVQVSGPDRVITQQVVQTQQQQSIVYQTVNRPQQVTVTTTVTGTCGQTGYNYDPPAVPFNIRG
ncbi:hypothetical protein O3P69_000882 [Scylla paramamosain]|uniref:Zonadhesin n=1 Tax=Scylla paramamosain TaxID=85552 RepID=A0AAW0URZ6_SCYPA